MKVKNIIDALGLTLIGGDSGLYKDVTGVYTCDLLSWVMSHAKEGNAWITIQTHSNIVAVAVLLELSCIIIPENTEIDEDTLLKADQEGIPIMSSSYDAYTLSYKLHELMDKK